jgi:hypothetical protein
MLCIWEEGAYYDVIIKILLLLSILTNSQHRNNYNACFEIHPLLSSYNYAVLRLNHAVAQMQSYCFNTPPPPQEPSSSLDIPH